MKMLLDNQEAISEPLECQPFENYMPELKLNPKYFSQSDKIQTNVGLCLYTTLIIKTVHQHLFDLSNIPSRYSVHTLLDQIMPQWDRYSGSETYPVPSGINLYQSTEPGFNEQAFDPVTGKLMTPHRMYEDNARSGMNLYYHGARYCQARWELAEFIYQYVSDKLDEMEQVSHE